MVLKVTEPFTYDLNDGKMMFHATVATENEFFRVKIFDPVLKNKFIPNKIIAISNYFGLNGFLEIYQASCVSDVDKNRMMDIPKTLKRRANATPKIKDLISQAQGTYVNGEFVVYEVSHYDTLEITFAVWDFKLKLVTGICSTYLAQEVTVLHIRKI